MSIQKRFLKAIELGDVDAVDQMLKSKEVDVNQKLRGKTVLMRAVDCGNPDLVACIIENGADVGTDDAYYGSSLHWAIKTYDWMRDRVEAKRRSLKMFRLIFEAYKKLGLKKLIEAAFIVRSDADTAFLAAIRREISDVVLVLLYLINEETVQVLNVDHFQGAYGTNPFHYVHRLNDEAMNALFDRLPFKQQMINGRKDGFTPLHLVIYTTDRSFVVDQHRAAVLLLKNGANPNLPDQLGQTPLHRAIIRRSNTSICEVLLRAGCRMDIFDTWGSSALKMAIVSHNPDFSDLGTTIKLIKLLLAYGVDLDKELYLYADDELPVEYRFPAYEGQINAEYLHAGLLEKLRGLRICGALNSLQQRCRVVILRNLKINEMETPEQRSGNDMAIDSLPLPGNLKSYLRADGDKVLAMLDN